MYECNVCNKILNMKYKNRHKKAKYHIENVKYGVKEELECKYKKIRKRMKIKRITETNLLIMELLNKYLYQDLINIIYQYLDDKTKILNTIKNIDKINNDNINTYSFGIEKNFYNYKLFLPRYNTYDKSFIFKIQEIEYIHNKKICLCEKCKSVIRRKKEIDQFDKEKTWFMRFDKEKTWFMRFDYYYSYYHYYFFSNLHLKYNPKTFDIKKNNFMCCICNYLYFID